MKTLIIKNDIHGTSAEVSAQNIYENSGGQWVAEVDEKEFNRACSVFCRDVEGCSCEEMHGQSDLDDDGKEYRIMSS